MKFSIITPSYNQIDWLRLCVASVRDQIAAADGGMRNNPDSEIPNSKFQIPPLFVEHIIQDAGTPGIEGFAREVGADFYRDGKLVFSRSASQGARSSTFQNPSSYRIAIHSESDSGMYDAINRGLLRASGEICAWLNCDEQYLPGALEAVALWFEKNPTTEIVFGDCVVTNARGHYLCSRTGLVPGYWHTVSSGNLSFLSAAAFFRRSIVEKNLLLPEGWRIIGDAAWTAELIKAGISMGTTRRYFSAYANTGKNLSFDAAALEEKRRLRGGDGLTRKLMGFLAVLHFRFRKFFSGSYQLEAFSYSVFTRDSPEIRRIHKVLQPSQVWKTAPAGEEDSG